MQQHARAWWPLHATISALALARARRAAQESVAAVGKIAPPITADGPETVPGEDTLIQAMNGALEDASPNTRGLRPAPATADVPGLSGGTMVRPPAPAPPMLHALQACALFAAFHEVEHHESVSGGALIAHTCTPPEEQ